ncbi:hypothetical protein [Acanthamoeba castellanii mimivirus]|uniref:Uncharacterized protein L412 n=6 Tax=Mimivirus TaxID=315393 RepID=YL412_MIMIV|nr:hypothetical protein MIMI_gp0442 [Acanthamoeba polyphaga mimivirus]Q5UQK8.1 RecName: Full=Uncharacterized protein L412 [Acanthamoeba polyphaga mimivirus]AHJ40103.1 hypothetical protein [Samba virus]ALR84002.1 hypothetical protein [Niemeyer virus]AMZ02856.1 hypothetical protein [Mimivirus Bombay]BAV61513.1 hypothetical protein [Acanthamoeba castellanii mimivirus]AAV50681.1 unknown [Acanthamoeba polyphaga mimivirus]
MHNYTSDSDEEIKLEFTDNGKSYTKVYHIPYRTNHSNEKKLICFSIINGENCIYGPNCTYAHSLSEQIIEEDKKFIYRIILDENLMGFSSISESNEKGCINESNKNMSDRKIEEIYKKLLNLTHICEKCTSNKCTGGYNCRNGVFDSSLKICKNDLLTGECLNKLVNIKVDEIIVDKLNSNQTESFKSCQSYQGCINGHHLTLRNIIPYYKYVHQKENSRKYQYQSVRYIDIDQLGKLFCNNNVGSNTYCYQNESDDTESSTDEEISSWFRKDEFEFSDSDNTV